MHCRSARAVRLALLLLGLVGSGHNFRSRAADAASTDRERVYEVRKKVADFPNPEDLSTPETAYAAIGRNWVMEGDWGPGWLRLCVPEFARLPPRASQPLPKDKADIVLGSESWYLFTRMFWIRAIAGCMHSPLVMGLGDGKAFFGGIAVVLLAVLLLLRFRRKLAAALLIAAALIGIACVVLSATPLPTWSYAVWLGAAAASLLLCRKKPAQQKARLAATGALLVASIGLYGAEIPYYRFPRVSVGHGETIYVLGDSLSAGKDASSKERCWPAVLGDMTQLTVVNFAQPGARLRGAMEQSKRVMQPNAPIILEIGANDTVEDGPNVAKFREQFDALVGSLRDHRPMLMFEIPLFPLQNVYGQVQREVAAKYGVILIPKRCLMSVWCLKGGTLDGIHFSQTGHNAIARMIADVLKIEDAASHDGDPDSANKPAGAVADEPLASAAPTRP